MFPFCFFPFLWEKLSAVKSPPILLISHKPSSAYWSTWLFTHTHMPLARSFLGFLVCMEGLDYQLAHILGRERMDRGLSAPPHSSWPRLQCLKHSAFIGGKGAGMGCRVQPPLSNHLHYLTSFETFVQPADVRHDII